MQLDIHVPRFTWPGGPAAIGADAHLVAQTAEAIGVRTLSVMDHWFQMEMMWPADEPMLEGYTTLSFAAADRTAALAACWWGGDLPPSRAAGQDGHHPRRALGRTGRVGPRCRLVRAGAPRLGVPFPPLTERYERLEETLQICLQMWSDDNGPYEGKHYQLAETLCCPRPVSSPRPRVLIGGGGERKTLRLVAVYADACNIIGDADTVAHKVEVLHRHCQDVGRDPAEIEVTALTMVSEDADADAILHDAEALSAAGAAAVVIRSTGPDPAHWLEETWGPIVPRLADIG